MPQFQGPITDSQADTLVTQMLAWCIGPHERDNPQAHGRSIVACIICDAASADITLQPLHEAYARAMRARGW